MPLVAAFCGESMFSGVTDASKVALVQLVARLKVGGYRLFDAQFPNPHLEQFGQEEWPRARFRAALERALRKVGDFAALDAPLAALKATGYWPTGAGSTGGGASSATVPGASSVAGASSNGAPRPGNSAAGVGGAQSPAVGAAILQVIAQTS